MKKDCKNRNDLKNDAIRFINYGISCNCLVLLKGMGLLDFLLNGNSLDNTIICNSEFCTNYIAAQSALVTLEKSGVLEKSFGKFNLTEFGHALCGYLGLITMLFDGYGQLMSYQKKIAKNQVKEPFKLMRIDSITESSILFGKNTVDPVISQLFERIKIKGTICDLGCGLGTRLVWMCKTTGNPGLGIENDDKAVRIASKNFKNEKLVSFERGDISNLDGTWEDVTVVMQYFVFHDFVKSSECVSILNSYLHNFPNLKCFIYVDVVAPSETKNQIMPGYDYVHGLLGISTPTYEDTVELFEKSNYSVVEEIPIPDLPNTFAWLLCPKNLKK